MSSPDVTSVAGDSLRARNKLDKLRRIKDAAESLFIAKGFDDTTMREIAIRAGVGLGTIFLYAKNKRDLLFLTINQSLEAVTERAETAIDAKSPIIKNLLAVAKRHYEFFGKQPALSRLVLREMVFYDSGTQAVSFQKTRERLIQLFGRTVEMAAASGEITLSEDPMFVGWTLFSIFQVELRRWLARDTVQVRTGMQELERAFQLLIRGLGGGTHSRATVRDARSEQPRASKNGPR